MRPSIASVEMTCVAEVAGVAGSQKVCGLGIGFGDGGAEGGDAARLDGSVAACEALDREGKEFLGADERGGFVPGAEVGQRKEPGGEAADGEVAFADEGVAGVEGAVAFVEKGEVAGDVARGFDGAEGTDELALSDKSGGTGFDAGDAAFDCGLGLVGLEGRVGRLLEERQAARVGDELDVRGAEFLEEGVDGAEVIHVGVGEKNAAMGAPRVRAAARMSSWEPGRPVSMRVRSSGSRTR
jgi:hypothetical protein